MRNFLVKGFITKLNGSVGSAIAISCSTAGRGDNNTYRGQTSPELDGSQSIGYELLRDKVKQICERQRGSHLGLVAADARSTTASGDDGRRHNLCTWAADVAVLQA